MTFINVGENKFHRQIEMLPANRPGRQPDGRQSVTGYVRWSHTLFFACYGLRMIRIYANCRDLPGWACWLIADG
ncbi:hypothetical protein [Melaminivora sp.]